MKTGKKGNERKERQVFFKTRSHASQKKYDEKNTRGRKIITGKERRHTKDTKLSIYAWWNLLINQLELQKQDSMPRRCFS